MVFLHTAIYLILTFMLLFVTSDNIHRVQKKRNNIVLYITFTNLNIVLIVASNIVDVLQNYYYKECSHHLISAATLPCKIK